MLSLLLQRMRAEAGTTLILVLGGAGEAVAVRSAELQLCVRKGNWALQHVLRDFAAAGLYLSP